MCVLKPKQDEPDSYIELHGRWADQENIYDCCGGQIPIENLEAGNYLVFAKLKTDENGGDYLGEEFTISAYGAANYEFGEDERE